MATRRSPTCFSLEYDDTDYLECNADGTIRVSKCPDTLEEVAHMEP